MITTEPWVRALDRVTIALIEKLEQALKGKPTRPKVITGTALGICNFWLHKLDIPDLDVSARGEIEQALVVRVARRFTLGMELKPLQDRAKRDSQVEQILHQVSRETGDRLTLILKSAEAKDTQLYNLGMLITMDLMDLEKIPPMRPEGWMEYILCSREVMLLAFTGSSMISGALESARRHT